MIFICRCHQGRGHASFLSEPWHLSRCATFTRCSDKKQQKLVLTEHLPHAEATRWPFYVCYPTWALQWCYKAGTVILILQKRKLKLTEVAQLAKVIQLEKNTVKCNPKSVWPLSQGFCSLHSTTSLECVEAVVLFITKNLQLFFDSYSYPYIQTSEPCSLDLWLPCILSVVV